VKRETANGRRQTANGKLETTTANEANVEWKMCTTESDQVQQLIPKT